MLCFGRIQTWRRKRELSTLFAYFKRSTSSETTEQGQHGQGTRAKDDTHASRDIVTLEANTAAAAAVTAVATSNVSTTT